MQTRLLPVLENVERGVRSFAVAMERQERGEGSVGRLLANETLARDAEAAARRVATILETLGGAAALNRPGHARAPLRGVDDMVSATPAEHITLDWLTSRLGDRSSGIVLLLLALLGLVKVPKGRPP